MKQLFVAIAMAAALVSAALATETTAAATTATGATANAAALAEGEVRKIDKDAKKITIRHGEIESLGMPPMTMVFHIADPATLDTVRVGDKIRFAAEKRDAGLTVTRIERAT